MQTALSSGSAEPAALLWEQASKRLKRALSEGNYSAWFDNIKPLRLDDTTVVLEVPNPFTKQWIETRYIDLVRDALREAAQRDIAVDFAAGAPSAADEIDDPQAGDEDDVSPPVGTDPLPPAHQSSTFHPKYTFDSFVIGSSNRFAHAATLAVAEGPAQAYNPLFIYGGSGLGKTHLLHAIGSYVKQCHPRLVVRYVSTEQFVNDFIVAIQRRSMPEFHSRYRAADVLLVDDIQFLIDKERSEEEFFHTFNAVHPTGQIVLTCDRPPKKISALEERLRTRFEWGLVTDIQPPDLETRLAILQKKSETERLPVPPDVMSFIASRIQTNIRELEGALIRVAAYASLTRSEATLELAQNVLASLLTGTREAPVTADLIISVTADYFGLSDAEICSSSRSRPLVNARQAAMYLCRELTDLSLPKIGERFGGRDHSTVIHATTKIRHQLQERQSCYEQVQELTARIRHQADRR